MNFYMYINYPIDVGHRFQLDTKDNKICLPRKVGCNPASWEYFAWKIMYAEVDEKCHLKDISTKKVYE